MRGRIMGGCSAHNGCVILRGAPADYDEWGPGWTAEDLTPYLDRAERELATRPLGLKELSPWHLAFADAAGEDAIVNPVNMTADGVRWSAAFAYVDPARSRPNLTILAGALVDRVLLAGERAVGVATSNGEVRGGTVVLAAGAYGSPAVLLRSGIGPESGLPVGENLLDHVGVGATWKPTDELRGAMDDFTHEHDLTLSGVTIKARSSAGAEDVCDLFLVPMVEPDRELAASVFAMKPRSRGRVTLTSLDPRAPLHIEHGFLTDEEDADVLVEGFELLRELCRSEPIRRYAAQESSPGEEIGAREHVRASASGFFHPIGTCAIGKVIDERGRVFGYEDLVVADASTMPTIPRANTNLTTAAIAERMAELI
ncbi:MAG: GMC family oxidoreductase [Gaiellaceae bacterium]